MATPPAFAFRMPPELADKLRDVAKAYSPSGSTGILLRDMVSAIVSGDAMQIAAFNQKLMDRLTNQMSLDLQEMAKEKAALMASRPDRKKPKRKGKGRGRHV
jgi:hypothetical protein